MTNISLKKIAAILSIAIGCISCVDDTTSIEIPEEEYGTVFLSQTEIGAVVNAEMVKVFNMESDQIIFTDKRDMYAVTNLDYTSHFTLTIVGELVLDNKIYVEYTSSNVTGLGDGIINMEVVKIDTVDKRYWLWNSDLYIGFIVDFEI